MKILLWDSNSDRKCERWARWQLDHHHGPNLLNCNCDLETCKLQQANFLKSNRPRSFSEALPAALGNNKKDHNFAFLSFHPFHCDLLASEILHVTESQQVFMWEKKYSCEAVRSIWGCLKNISSLKSLGLEASHVPATPCYLFNLYLDLSLATQNLTWGWLKTDPCKVNEC